MLLIEYVTGIRACTPFSDVILHISRNIAHENRSFRVRLYSPNEISTIDSPDFYVPPSSEGRHIYIIHLAPDPRFDKVAIAKTALGGAHIRPSWNGVRPFGKLGWLRLRNQTGNPPERMDEYE